jgi:endonuclease-3 related protein
MKIFEKIYLELKKKYGKPAGQWQLWCKRPKTEREREEVIIGAILTQRTNWKNVELALNNLKKAKINSLREIYRTGKRSLAPFIKPAGFYQIKAGYLFNLAKFILKNYGGLEKMKKKELKGLREELLKLKGIGPETADSILLYALDKPIFVIDEYTRRLIRKYNLAKNLNYHFLQKLFEENLRKDFRLYQDFHALIVIDGKSQHLSRN